MKKLIKFAMVGFLLVFLVFAGAGCGKLSSAEGDSPAPASEPLPPWQFVEGRGVKLSDPAMAIAGVELADVSFGEAEEETNYLIASGQVLAAAGQSGNARVNVTLPAERAAGVEIGALVKAGGGSGSASLAGWIERVDQQAAAATGNVELIVSLEDPERALRQGRFVTVGIVRPGTEDAEILRIPASALLTTARGAFVYVINGEHYFRSPVEVGRQSGRSVEIVDGLFEGDVVVSAGVEDLWLIELQAINGGESCADSH